MTNVTQVNFIDFACYTICTNIKRRSWNAHSQSRADVIIVVVGGAGAAMHFM